MEYLHSKHIVHFDLKSANLLLGYKDRRAICKVADFGLSKQKRDTYVSNVSSQRGTLPWIAPEIIKTPHEVTEKVCSGACLSVKDLISHTAILPLELNPTGSHAQGAAASLLHTSHVSSGTLHMRTSLYRRHDLTA